MPTNVKPIYSWHPFQEDTSAEESLHGIRGERKLVYAGPWVKVKYLWLMYHYPYGTALHIEKMARNLGVDDPTIAVALDDGCLAVICGCRGIIMLEIQDESTPPG
jgi:hypothetical protein